MTKELVGRVHKEGSGTIWLKKRGCIELTEMARAKLRQKLPTPASLVNGINTDVVFVVAVLCLKDIGVENIYLTGYGMQLVKKS